jgi:hypothetical protein
MSLDSQIFENLPYIEATLNYLTPMAEKPVKYTYSPPPGVPQQNWVSETRNVPIRDARSIVRDLSLDREGFVLVDRGSAVRDFYDENEVLSVYYPEAEQLVADVTGATRVLAFDHNVRNAGRALQGEKGISEPVKHVHNDVTASTGYSRARAVLEALGTEDPESLLQHRFSMINVWRPIAEPVKKSPLAVCDAQSIASADLIASDIMFPNRVGEIYEVTYNPKHRWFYFSQMQPNEALLFKCFDSALDGRARFPAHSAFEDPTSPPSAPPRQSIELRTLVFF